MTHYTPAQTAYIHSVDGQAHQSAVDAIARLEQRLAAVLAAAEAGPPEADPETAEGPYVNSGRYRAGWRAAMRAVRGALEGAGGLMKPDPRESLILEVLAAGEKPGREIRDECQLLTGRVWPLGSLYVLLEGLKDRGILSARDGDPSPERGGNRRRYYRLNAPADPPPLPRERPG